MGTEHRASFNVELSLAVSLLKETVIQQIVSHQEMKTGVDLKSHVGTLKIYKKEDANECYKGEDGNVWKSEENVRCMELCNHDCTILKDELVHVRGEKELLKLEVDSLKEENQKLKQELAETIADCQFLSNNIKDELICVKRDKELLKLEVNALKEGRGELKGELAETITDCESLAKIIKEKKDLIDDRKWIDNAVNTFDKQRTSEVLRVSAVKRKTVEDKAQTGISVRKRRGGLKVCKVGEGCLGCSAPECGECGPCLDHPSRGGGNTLRKRCKMRRCRTGTGREGEDRTLEEGKVEDKNNCVRFLSF